MNLLAFGEWLVLAVLLLYILWLAASLANHSGRIADRLGEIEQHLREIAARKSV